MSEAHRLPPELVARLDAAIDRIDLDSTSVSYNETRSEIQQGHRDRADAWGDIATWATSDADEEVAAAGIAFLDTRAAVNAAIDAYEEKLRSWLDFVRTHSMHKANDFDTSLAVTARHCALVRAAHDAHLAAGSELRRLIAPWNPDRPRS